MVRGERETEGTHREVDKRGKTTRKHAATSNNVVKTVLSAMCERGGMVEGKVMSHSSTGKSEVYMASNEMETSAQVNESRSLMRCLAHPRQCEDRVLTSKYN